MPTWRLYVPVLILAVAGCGKPAGDPQAAATGSAAPTAAAVGSSKLTKLNIKDITVGAGPAVAKIGDKIWVWYEGTTVDGNVFDGHKPPEDPISFTLQEGALIKGWTDGVPGMKVGGVRKLEIPAKLAYGEQAKDKIPANSDLYFTMTLAYVVHPGEEKVFDLKDDKVGTGAEVKKGSKVSILYTGTLLSKKEVMKEMDPKKPVSFTVGKGEVLEGLDYGVIGMKMGGKRTLTLPPDAAFGMSPANQAIPPGSPMIFHVEVVDVK